MGNDSVARSSPAGPLLSTGFGAGTGPATWGGRQSHLGLTKARYSRWFVNLCSEWLVAPAIPPQVTLTLAWEDWDIGQDSL